MNNVAIPAAMALAYDNGPDQLKMTKYRWPHSDVECLNRVSTKNAFVGNQYVDDGLDVVGKFTLFVGPVPEPSTHMLAVVTTFGIAARPRRRRGRHAQMIACLALVAMVTVSTDAEAAVVIWDPNDGGNGHAYELVTNELSWPDARNAAAIAGPSGFRTGHLVSISDASENEFLRVTFAALTPHGFYMGFTDELVEGERRRVDDTPGVWQDPDNFANPVQSTYTNWHPFEPNDNPPNGEDYGIFNGGAPGTWNDGESTPAGPYVVEYDPVPEPATLLLVLPAVVLLLLRRPKR